MNARTLPDLPTNAVVWTGTEMIYPPSPPKPVASHPGWVWVCCGCCAGIMWGGEEPRECRDCGATGFYAVHLATGRGALWPGGPFNGWRWRTRGERERRSNRSDRERSGAR